MGRHRQRKEFSVWARRPRTRAALLVPLLLLAALPAFAELLPGPEAPLAGVYTAWLERERFEKEGWIRGMNSRHWLPPSARPRALLLNTTDEIRILPELGIVLWIRKPSILAQLSPLADGPDPYGNRVRAAWPGAQVRTTMSRDSFLEATIRVRRRKLLLEKAAITRAQVKQEDARGSLIDITIPIKLPDSIERIVGRGEKTNITVTGRESITLGGETSRTNKFLTDESGRGQPLFPRLEMKQDLQVKLSGTVGEKVHVEVENNSLAIGDAAHRIRIRYEGDDDEIIKSIEMGDTQLSLPSSGLVSYSGTNKGLFGVKMEGNMGPLDFTAIASKQEGEVANRTFNNSGQVIQSDFVTDTSFLANQFFYLDNPLNHPSGWTVDYGTLNVFVEDHSPPNPQGDIQYAGFAFNDLGGDGLEDDMLNEEGTFGSYRLLELGRDYRVLLDVDQSFRAIQLNFSLQESDLLAVSYQAREGESVLHPIGTTDLSAVLGWFSIDPDTLEAGDEGALLLEMIKPETFVPTSPTWNYMMRNVYRLGGRNLDYGTLDVEIHRVSTRPDPSHPEGDNTPYLRIFGLDQFGADNQSAGHNQKIDQAWVDAEQGLVFFPWFQPFDPPASLVCDWTRQAGADTTCFELTSDDRNATIYSVSRRELLRDPNFSKYLIRFSSATASSRFVLNAFDILEGSEVVSLDGTTLTRGQDYRIDYFSGEVELIGDTATRLTPASNVSITYQFRPLIGGGKSSLLGVHGTYKLGEKNNLSSSWLYESQNSGARRPRLGEESTRNVVGNLLGNFTAAPGFLTSAVNLLPRVDTDAPSTVNLSGELAVSFPNPNVAGDSFLEDMEGAEDADELGLHRSQWVPPSEPIDRIRVPGGADIDVLPANRAQYAYWFHPQDRAKRVDFNLNLREQEARETIEVLHLAVPVNLTAGQLAAVPSLAPVNEANAALGDSIWAGLMRGFTGEGLDLSEAEYIEIWVNDFQQEERYRVGRMHFDLGDIDEDYYNPELNLFDTEDRFNRGVFDEVDEDTGLDGLYDTGEGALGNPFATPDDPAGDDYEPAQLSEGFANSYFKVNGREGNRRLDTEDLDGDGQLDTRNNYYTLDVALGDEPLIDMVSVYADAGQVPESGKAWRLYRLSLADVRAVGDGVQLPDLTRVKYFRFWLEGFNAGGQNPSRPFNQIQIASIKIVGNRWKSHGIQTVADGRTLIPGEIAAGEDIRVEVINSKDNANFTWPFGEQIDPETGLPEREQALNFVYEALQPGHQGLIRKDYQSLNLTGYRAISFYLHPDALSVNHDIFFRAAFDSLNYYEVVHRPEIPGWHEVNIDLSALTQLKLSEADTATAVAPDTEIPGRNYTVRRVGQPDLSRIRAVYFGVVNGEGDQELSGETWFNDIRVKDVRRDTGFAGKLNGTVNLANLVNIGFTFQETDPEFRGLRATSGSGVSNRNLGLSVSSGLQHFLPLAGYRVPVSARFGRSVSTPKYELGSDVELIDPVLRAANRSEATNQSFSVSVSRAPSRNWLGRILLDNIRLQGALSQRHSEGPTRVELQESVDYSVSYDAQIGERKLRLFRTTHLRWLPNSFSLKSDTRRSWSKTWTAVGSRYTLNPSSPSGKLTNTARLQWNFFPTLRSDFNISESRELEHDEARHERIAGVDVNLGFQTGQSQGLSLNWTLPFTRRFNPKINFQSHYSQSVQTFVAGVGQVPDGTMNLLNDNSISTGHSFNVGSWFRRLGGSHLQKDAQARPGGRPGRSEPPSVHRTFPQRVLVPVGPERGPDPRQRSRSTRRFFPEVTLPDTLPVEAPADSSKTDVDPLVVVWKTLGILSGLKPVKVDVSRSVNTAFNNVRGNPSPLYRFGFSENPEMVGIDTGGIEAIRKRADRLDESRDLRISTGVTIAERLSVTGGYDRSWSDREGSSTHTRNVTVKWPNMSIDLSGVEKWAIWGEMMELSSIGFGYSRNSTVSENLGTGLVSRNESTSLTPRWGVTWRNKLRTNLTSSYSTSSNIQNTQETKTSSLNLGTDFSYNLSAPNGLGIPGLRGIRFQSRMDLTGAVNFTRSSSVRVEGSGFEVPLGGSKNLSLSPGARYQFSDKISGGLTLRYNRSSKNLTGEVITTFGVSLNTSFIF